MIFFSCGDPSKNFGYPDQMAIPCDNRNDAILSAKNDVNERTTAHRTINLETSKPSSKLKEKKISSEICVRN